MRDAERGSVSPVVLFSSILVAVLGLGGATVGRIVSARQDAQRAADSSALAAADSIRIEGMQGPYGEARGVGDRNVRAAAPSWTEEVYDYPDQIVVAAEAGIPVGTPRFVNAGGEVRAQALGRARVNQYVQSNIQWKYPKMALVLDYSGSMATTMQGGGGQQAMEILEDSIRGMLDDGLRLEFSAAFFASSLLATVEFGPDAVDEIRQQLDSLGPESATCTSCGLNAAYESFENQENTGFFVLLVSDGAPNDGGGAAGAYQAAQRLWEDRGATIFSLHIDYSGGSDSSLRQFMQSVSGTPDEHPNPEYYFPVTNASDLDGRLREILAAIVCTIGPLDTSTVEDPSTISVFLRDEAGNERKVPYQADLGENPDALGFRYEASTGIVRMTHAGCEAVANSGDEVVIRYNRARLIP